MAELRWATGTHEGQVREINEDAAYANPHLFVVADGMGGHLAGEVASAMAIETLESELDAQGANSLDDLVAAISLANKTIFTNANDNPEHSGMGTTVTAIAVIKDRYDGEALGVANVGDSRIYQLRHRRLRQVTIDHSFVQELIAEGAITRDEARNHPRRNIVTRGLGIESAVRVDSWTMPLIRGDRYVLCSDGLSDYVSEDDMTDILLHHPDEPANAVIELIDRANAAGGADNITVVVVDVLEGDDPPDPTEELDVVPTWFDDDDDDDDDDDATTKVARSDDATSDGDDDVAVLVPPAPGPDTAESTSTTDSATQQGSQQRTRRGARKQRGGNRVLQLFLLVGVAAVLIGGFAVLAGWARGGYFVAFDDAGEVTIYRGRMGGVLWFEPTVAGKGRYSRSELDARSIAKVEEHPMFGSLANAQRFMTEQLSPKPSVKAVREAPDATPPPTQGGQPEGTTEPPPPTTATSTGA